MGMLSNCLWKFVLQPQIRDIFNLDQRNFLQQAGVNIETHSLSECWKQWLSSVKWGICIKLPKPREYHRIWRGYNVRTRGPRRSATAVFQHDMAAALTDSAALVTCTRPSQSASYIPVMDAAEFMRPQSGWGAIPSWWLPGDGGRVIFLWRCGHC